MSTMPVTVSYSVTSRESCAEAHILSVCSLLKGSGCTTAAADDDTPPTLYKVGALV